MENKSENKLGLLGFILSLLAIPLVFVFGLGMILAIVAIILCIIQLTRKPTGLAIAGLVIGIIALIVLPIIAIGIISVIGFQLASNEQLIENQQITTELNGITFTQEGDFWKFQKDGSNFLISNSPEDIDYINIPVGKEIKDLSNKPLYIVGGETSSTAEISRTLNKVVERVQPACISEINCEDPLPIKKCSEDNIIIIKVPENNEGQRVYFEDKCVYIVTEENNQVKYYDAFLLKILDIS